MSEARYEHLVTKSKRGPETLGETLFIIGFYLRQYRVVLTIGRKGGEMPYKDREKVRQYQREWVRQKRGKSLFHPDAIAIVQNDTCVEPDALDLKDSLTVSNVKGEVFTDSTYEDKNIPWDYTADPKLDPRYNPLLRDWENPVPLPNCPDGAYHELRRK